MKKIFCFALSLTIIFLFSQCEKEPSSSVKSELYSSMPVVLQGLYDQLPTHDFGNITVIGDGILRFTSFSEYERVYGLLNQDCETWDSLFYNMYSHLNDDSLTEVELSLGYNEFQPLVEFEYQYEVLGRMLRDQQELAINNWLSNNMAFDNPSDTIIIDEVEQALFNSNREICIGDSIYQFRENGHVVIPIDSADKMTTYRRMSLSTLQERFHVVLKNYDPTIGFIYIPKTWSGRCQLSNTERTDWFVTGKHNCSINNRERVKMVCKMTNYKYNSKRNKYVKARQKCDLTTDLEFYWEAYTTNVLPEDNGLTELHTRELVERKRMTRRVVVKDSVSMDEQYDFYCFGVKKYPVLKMTIKGVENEELLAE